MSPLLRNSHKKEKTTFALEGDSFETYEMKESMIFFEM